MRESQKLNIKFCKLEYKCRKKKIKLSLTFKTFLFFMGYDCFYCSQTATGLDRVDNKKGYVNENVVACCEECNRLKSDKYSLEETLLMLDLIKTFKRS